MSDRAMWKMLHLLYTLPPGHRGLDHQQLNDVGITCGPDTVHPLQQSGAVLFTNGVYTLSSPARAILQSCLVANRRWTGTEIAVDRPAAFVIMEQLSTQVRDTRQLVESIDARDLRRGFTLTLLLLLGAAWLVSLLPLLLIAHRVSRPMRQLTAALTDFAGGDWSRRLDAGGTTGGRSRDEVALAIEAFNHMIPALLSKKTGVPVMMRITREEENYIGGIRPAVHGRVKAGFAKDGRLLAVDMYAIGENSAYEAQGDAASGGRFVSLLYQPEAMRSRAITVLTNTPPRRAQSQPGGLQAIMPAALENRWTP